MMLREYDQVRLLTFNFNITQSTITLRITYNFPNAGGKREKGKQEKKVADVDDVTDGEQEEKLEGTLSLSLSLSLSFSFSWLLAYLHDVRKYYQFNIM